MSPRRAQWFCEVCEGEIADGDGYLTIRQDDLDDATQVRAPWWVLHGRCDFEPEMHPFRIPVEEVRTEVGVRHWTVALAMQGWVARTDWALVVEGVGHVFEKRAGLRS